MKECGDEATGRVTRTSTGKAVAEASRKATEGALVRGAMVTDTEQDGSQGEVKWNLDLKYSRYLGET